jgi:uncharacterized membrane protein
MTKLRTIGNLIAPPRFLIFIATLIVAAPIASHAFGRWALGIMAAFDLAAIVFLLSCLSLLSTRKAAEIREHASDNDANRRILLAITTIVMTVLLVAIAAEAVGRSPQPFTKVMIIVTLILAWLFSNLVYALHYAHLAYSQPESGCLGFDFPGTKEPVYWDFVYFSFTCGMAFANSDVAVTISQVRKTVTFHCLAAFAFNFGVLAFTINLLASG